MWIYHVLRLTTRKRNLHSKKKKRLMKNFDAMDWSFKIKF